MTAEETTAGAAAAPVPVNVVLGDNANDVVHPATLAGLTPSAPTFLYGLGGNDTLDASGLTGTVCFAGGAGADMMTGGTGVNIYAYGGAANSTASAMDIITNFNVTVDLIDLTALATPLTSPAAEPVGGTTLAPGAITWQTAAGNTFIYVNNSNRTEALTAANMKIELTGGIPLTAASFFTSDRRSPAR